MVERVKGERLTISGEQRSQKRGEEKRQIRFKVWEQNFSLPEFPHALFKVTQLRLYHISIVLSTSKRFQATGEGVR